MTGGHPSFLIVPGCYHQPEAYEQFVAVLKKTGCSVPVPKLPSCNSADPGDDTCSKDAEAIRKEIVHLIDASETDLVVVCHSYGGIPGGGAAYGLSKAARAQEGKKGGIIGLIYVSGIVVAEGKNFLETVGGKLPPYVVIDQPVPHLGTIQGARDVFYNDLNDTEAETLAKLLRPNSLRALDSPAPPAAWRELEFAGKLGYVRCMQDNALPPSVQDMLMETSGVTWTVQDIDTSHHPFSSKPEDLVKIIEDFVLQFKS